MCPLQINRWFKYGKRTWNEKNKKNKIGLEKLKILKEVIDIIKESLFTDILSECYGPYELYLA